MQGYNPDWSGVLSASQQQSQTLGQLGQSVGQAFAQKREREQLQQQQQLAQEEISAAMQSGDPNQIAQVSIKYPEMSQAITGAMNFKDAATEKNFLDTNFKILSDPNNAEKYLNERVSYLNSVGGDPTETLGRLEMYKNNPDQFLKLTEGVTAATSPDRYKSYKSSQITQQAPQYSNVQFDQQGRPFGLNKQTGQYEPVGGGFVRGKQTPQTVVNVGGNQSEFDKELGKQNAKAFMDITSTGKQLRSEENKINRLMSLNDKAYEGAGAGAKVLFGQIAKTVGVDVEGLPESEAFRAVSNELVLDKSQQMSGALSEGDMAFLRDTVPNLNNTKEGRKQVFDYSKSLIKRQKEYIKQANEFRRKNKYFDQGEFDAQFQQYADSNPLFESPDVSTMSDDQLSKSLGL